MPVVYPKWLRVSPQNAEGSIFEVKDMDKGFSEIYEVVNGKLTDENFHDVPQECVAWHGRVKDVIGAPPSWSGHIHDGVSARGLAAGFVGKQDIPYDGSLGVMNHPEDDFYYAGYASLRVKNEPSYPLDGPGKTYLFNGRFGIDVLDAGTTNADASYADLEGPYIRNIAAVVPVDMSELEGDLVNPVPVATLHAEMSSDTLPEKEIPNRDETAVEDRFWGMGIIGIDLFPVYRKTPLSPVPSKYRGYQLGFLLQLPGPDHPISLGVSRWWIHWMLLCREAPGLTTQA